MPGQDDKGAVTKKDLEAATSLSDFRKLAAKLPSKHKRDELLEKLKKLGVDK